MIMMDSTMITKAGMTNSGFGVCGLCDWLGEVGVKKGECSTYVPCSIPGVFYSSNENKMNLRVDFMGCVK